MIKVIYLSFSNEGYDFDMFEQSFSTVDEAKEFIYKDIENDKNNFIDELVEDTLDDFEAKIEEYENEIDYKAKCFGELQYTIEYKWYEI